MQHWSPSFRKKIGRRLQRPNLDTEPHGAQILRGSTQSLPSRPAWRPPDWLAPNLLVTTLAVVALPFVGSAQELPRRPVPVVQAWSQNLLQSTLATPTPVFGKAQDLPPRPVSTAPSWSQNLLQTPLSATAPAPFFQSDWPVPVQRRLVALGFTNRALIVPAAASPFSQGDWPNPRIAPRALTLRTWTDSRLLDTLSIVLPRPFAQTDWPVPRPTRRGLLTWLSGPLVDTTETPFSESEWPVPRAAQRAVSLLTWTDNPRTTLSIVFPKPFSQTDWPIPKPIPSAVELRTWVQALKLPLIRQDRFFGAPGQVITYNLQNPRRPVPATTLLSWSENLLERTLGAAPPKPFAQVNWPNPVTRPHPLVLRSWLESLKLNLRGQDKFFGPPGMPPMYQPAPNPHRAPAPPWSWTVGPPPELAFTPVDFVRLIDALGASPQLILAKGRAAELLMSQVTVVVPVIIVTLTLAETGELVEGGVTETGQGAIDGLVEDGKSIT